MSDETISFLLGIATGALIIAAYLLISIWI
jgi:hypothetical protein